MICEACHGEGWIKHSGPESAPFLVAWPCFECNGSGVASCCDAAGSALFDDDAIAKRREAALGPGFWMHETTGVLRPAIEAYLIGRPITDAQIAAIRAYCRQWMEGEFVGEVADELRATIDGLTSRKALDEWMRKAMLAGIDPL
jgi:hypothetical protein